VRSPQDGCGSVTRRFGDRFHRQRRRFQQALSLANPRPRDPCCRRHPDVRAEATTERPTTHRGVTRNRPQRQVLAQIVLDPERQRPERRVRRIRLFVKDELRLSAGTLQRHHGGAGDSRGNLSAEVSSDEMETQIQSRGGASRRQHVTVVHVQHVGIHVNRWKLARQLRSGEPVRRRGTAAQRARAREHERAGANRCDACPAADSAAQFGDDHVGNSGLQVIDSRYHDRVGVPKRR
jgi:hypothetical protein